MKTRSRLSGFTPFSKRLRWTSPTKSRPYYRCAGKMETKGGRLVPCDGFVSRQSREDSLTLVQKILCPGHLQEWRRDRDATEAGKSFVERLKRRRAFS